MPIEELGQVAQALAPFAKIPNLLGPLGDVQPVAGHTKTWNWVIEEFRGYPEAFVVSGEAAFIHKDLYRNPPQAIRTAFGICAALISTHKISSPMLSRIVDAEVSGILNSFPSTTLFEDLANLQALVLCQVPKLLHGDIQQRLVTEQQEQAVETRALQVLARADFELGTISTWQDWLLAESVRRTAMVAFMLYAVYSVYRLGYCASYPTLSQLPVSTKPDYWTSEMTFLPHEDIAVKYDEFTNSWAKAPRKILDPFERMLLVSCKGIEKVEAFS
jgi:hypothetical protein